MSGLGAATILMAGALVSACGQTAAPVAADRPSPRATAEQQERTRDRSRTGEGPRRSEPVSVEVEPSPVKVAPIEERPRDRRDRPRVDFVVPGRIDLYLGRETAAGERTARIDLLAFGASNGCAYVGPLRHSTRYGGDRLVVRIEGFERSSSSREGMVCTAMIQHATASIVVERDWLVEGDRALLVRLGGTVNRFAFDYDDYYATLSPDDSSNVALHGRTAELFPMDVGELYVAGNVIQGTDYRPRLRRLARDRGWEPADEVYEGIRQPHPDRLFVVVRNRPIPRHGNRVGKVASGVHAYLTNLEDTPGRH